MFFSIHPQIEELDKKILSSAEKIISLCLLLLPVNIFANVKEEFKDWISPLSLEAQQDWVSHQEKADLNSLIVSIGSIFDREATRTGMVPLKFLPESKNTFSLPVYTISSEFIYEIGTRPYNSDQALWALHPLNLESSEAVSSDIRDWLKANAKSISLQPGFIATPTNSTRSLYTIYDGASLKNKPVFSIHKTAIPYGVSSHLRLLWRDSIVQSVNISRYYGQAHLRTGGKTAISHTPWFFKKESYGSFLKDFPNMGFIYREPVTIKNKNIDIIPLYGLNKKMKDGRFFLEHLIPETDPKIFEQRVFSEIIQPFWELYLELAFIDGIKQELHGQNANLYWDRKKNKIVGIEIQDLDNYIEMDLRRANGLDTTLIRPDWVEDSDFGFDKALPELVGNSMLEQGAFYYFNLYFLDFIFGAYHQEGVLSSNTSMSYYRKMLLPILQEFAKAKETQLGVVDSRSFSSFLESIKDKIATSKRLRKKLTNSSGNILGNEKVFSFLSEMQRATSGRILPRSEVLSLSDVEQELLVDSSRQQLLAIKLFLKNIVDGGNDWKKVISPKQLQEYLAYAGISMDQLMSKKSYEAFGPYAGVDFIKDRKSHEWYIIERQMAPVPMGIYELELLKDSQERSFGKSFTSDTIIDSLNRSLDESEGPLVILDYNRPKFISQFDSDSMAFRKKQKIAAELLRKKNVYLVTLDLLDGAQRSIECMTGVCLSRKENFEYEDLTTTSLKVTKQGLFLVLAKNDQITAQVRVNYLLNNLYPFEHSLQILPGVSQLIEDGLLKTNSVEYTNLMASKLFQSHIEKMIGVFLGEEPIVAAPETKTFINLGGNFDSENFREVFGSLSDWVIKPNIGFGGEGILLGEELATDSNLLRDVKNKLVNSPASFIAQRRIKNLDFLKSNLNDESIQYELRFFSGLTGKDKTNPWVSGAALARFSPLGSSKNNISFDPKNRSFVENLGLVFGVAIATKTGSNESIAGFENKRESEVVAKQGVIKPYSFRPNYRESKVDMDPNSLINSFFGENLSLLDKGNRHSILHSSRKQTSGALALNPIPIVLSSADKELIENISRQRTEALASLLTEYLYDTLPLAEKKWPYIIPEFVMKRFVELNELKLENISVNNLGILNAVDLLRSESGQFFVLEDNLTAPGGIHANELIREEFKSRFGSWAEKQDIGTNYSHIVEHYRKIVRKENPLVISLQYNFKAIKDFNLNPIMEDIFQINPFLLFSSEKEDELAERYTKVQTQSGEILRKSGLELISIDPKNATINTFTKSLFGTNIFTYSSELGQRIGEYSRLIVDNEQEVWLERYKTSNDELLSRKQVDAVIMNMVPRHALSYFSPLFESEKAGKLVLSSSHGIEVLDNKMIQSYMDDLIQAYLGELPAGSIPETIRFFDSQGKLDNFSLSKVFSQLGSWYLKSTYSDGGGVGIYSPRDLTESSALASRLIEEISEDPLSYIAVRKVVGSELLPTHKDEKSRLVDFRVFHLWNNKDGNISSTSLPYLLSRGQSFGVEKLNSSIDSDTTSFQVVVTEKAEQTENSSCKRVFRKYQGRGKI